MTQQLKKNTFLAAVTDEPMTREQLVDALSEYTFIASYLDYLTDHFEAQGKIIKIEGSEDGEIPATIQRKRGAVRTVSTTGLYQVVEVEVEGEEGETVTEYAMKNEKIGNIAALDLENWSKTPGAAAKKARSKVFQFYKSQVAEIAELLETTLAEKETEQDAK